MQALKPNAKNVLVVDDDEQINYLFCRQLKASGFQPHGVFSVAEAIAYLEHNTIPDILVLDMELTDGFGTQVLDYVRGRGYHQTKAVIVSANAFTRHYSTVDYAVDHVLMKPISPRGLSVFLSELVNQAGCG